MDKRRGEKNEKEKEKEKEREKRKRKKKEKKKKKGNLDNYNLNTTCEVVLPNIFQNGSSSIRKTDLPKEPELFLEEAKPCQTGPNSPMLIGIR